MSDINLPGNDLFKNKIKEVHETVYANANERQSVADKRKRNARKRKTTPEGDLLCQTGSGLTCAESARLLQDEAQKIQRDLCFEYHAGHNKNIILVKDTSTKELVRMIDCEEAIELAKNLHDSLGKIIKVDV